MIVLIKTT